MKRNIKIIAAFLVTGVAVVFSSCLKNNQYYVDLSQVGSLVEMPLAASQGNKPIVETFNVSSTPQSFPVYVNVAAPNALNVPVTATLGVDTAWLNQYNAAQGAADSTFVPYQVLPDSAYTVSGWDITVPAHQHLGNITVNVNTSKINTLNKYILPFTIVKSSQKISNWSHLMLNLTVKNKYDGNYGLVFRTTGWAAYGISDNLEGTWPVNANGTSIGMVTAGPNSVKLYDYVYFGFIQPAFTAGNASQTGFGNTAPKLTFDPTTNLLTDVSNDVVVDGRNRQFQLNTAVTDSRYDPATGTIYAAYIMTQNGRPPQYIYDTLTYIGPRP